MDMRCVHDDERERAEDPEAHPHGDVREESAKQRWRRSSRHGPRPEAMSMLKRPAARSVPARWQQGDLGRTMWHAPVLDLGQLLQGHVGRVGRLIMIKAFALGWCQMIA